MNAKSLLGVLSLGIVKGTSINLIADGPDEKEAVEALIELISSTSLSKSTREKSAAAAALFFDMGGEVAGRVDHAAAASPRPTARRSAATGRGDLGAPARQGKGGLKLLS